MKKASTEKSMEAFFMERAESRTS